MNIRVILSLYLGARLCIHRPRDGVELCHVTKVECVIGNQWLLYTIPLVLLVDVRSRQASTTRGT